MTDTHTRTTRMLRLREVEHLTGLRRSAIYLAAARGHFPRPRKLTSVATAWREDEIRAWIESRPLAAGSGEGSQPLMTGQPGRTCGQHDPGEAA